jgi:hypothetical protein
VLSHGGVKAFPCVFEGCDQSFHTQVRL